MLVGALIVVGLGLLGGPGTPFSVFRARIGTHHGQQDAAGDHDRRAGHGAGPYSPGAAGGVPPTGSPASPAPSPTRSSPAAPPRPPPTNKAGKTPRGHRRSKKPHPSQSPHAT
jgi:hypothetical protein